MGDTERAKDLSNKFTNRTLKAIALYGFDKCGNCVNRINCGEEILASGEKPRPLKFIVDSMMTGCPRTKFKSKGFIAKEVGSFVNGVCAVCDKNEICIGYLADHVGRSTPEEKEKMTERMQECLKCKDLDNCIHYFMTQLGISKTSLIKGAFLMKFRRCSKEDRMLISLDLDDTAVTKVGGSIKQGKKP
jgi:hypothetical protein